MEIVPYHLGSTQERNLEARQEEDPLQTKLMDNTHVLSALLGTRYFVLPLTVQKVISIAYVHSIT